MMTTTTPEMNEATRREWRELGFFYDCDENTSRWRFVGSHPGLLKFAELLESYAADPRNITVSEHEHYGPYFYLKLMTWSEPEITNSAICGTPADFPRLATIVRKKLSSSMLGSTFVIDDEYVSGSGSIEFHIRGDDFDPADADPLLSNDS
jgi:hypothetical protein